MKKTKLFLTAGLVIIIVFLVWAYFQYEVPVLTYHYFLEDRKGAILAVTPQRFREQLSFIRDRGYRVISLDDYLSLRQKGRSFPRNLVVITIDDGYLNNLEGAKILKEYSFPGTIFIPSEYVDRSGYLKKEDLDWITANTLVSIGSHTCSHAYLPEIDDQQLHREIFDSKAKLEEVTGRKINAFAFPLGGFDERTESLLRSAGYTCACTTNRGSSRDFSPYSIRRIKMKQRDKGIFLRAKLSGYYNLFRKVKKPY